MSRTGTEVCGVCQTRFGSTNCIEKFGQGTTDDPYKFDVILDPVDGNILQKSRNGIAAILPPIYYDEPSCYVYGSTEQPIGFGVLTPIFFNEELYDTDNMHDRNNNSSRIVINTAGVYELAVNLRWQKFRKDITGDVALYIRKNTGETLAFESDAYGNTDLYQAMSASCIRPLKAGDYVEALVLQDALDATDDETTYTNTLTTEKWPPSFSAEYLRPLPS